MRRAAPVPLLLLALAACGGGTPLAETDLEVRVLLGAGGEAEPVLPGRAFPLSVVRTWRADLTPEAFEERSLAPLVLVLSGVSRREDRGRVEETRRYDAYAFAREDVRVPQVVLRASPPDGGPPLKATSQRFRLRVEPSVEARAPGPPELPEGLLPPPGRPWAWIAAGLGLLVATALGFVARRRAGRRHPPSGAPAPAAPAPPAPHALALARLAALAAAAPGDAASRARDVEALADALRDYVAGTTGVPARTRTSEELLGALPAAFEPQREALRGLLARCDLVKFATHAPSAAERAAALEQATAIVRATARAEGAA